MTHITRIIAARHDVIRDATKFVNCQTEHYLLELSCSVHYLQRLVTETCDKCKGNGMLPGHNPGCYPQYEQCRGCKRCDCDNGRKTDAN